MILVRVDTKDFDIDAPSVIESYEEGAEKDRTRTAIQQARTVARMIDIAR